MKKVFKFNLNDSVYVIIASFANGKKHLYKKANVAGRFIDDKAKKYFIVEENSTQKIIYPEELLLNENELKLKLKTGSKLV